MPLHLRASEAAKLFLKGKIKLPAALKQALAEEPPKNSIDTWRKQRWPSFKVGPEDALQVETMNKLRQLLPTGWVAFHIPSEARRTKVWWAKLLAMGFILGLPDIVIFAPGARFACIELKAKTKLTPAQVAFKRWCEGHDVPWLEGRSWGDIEPFLTRLKNRF